MNRLLQRLLRGIVAVHLVVLPAGSGALAQPPSRSSAAPSPEQSTLLQVQTASPDLKMEKTSSKAVAALGEIFDFTLRVTNLGTVDSGPLVVDDYLPNGLDLVAAAEPPPEGVMCRVLNQGRRFQCGTQNLASMASLELKVRVQVSGALLGFQSNLATVSAPAEDTSSLGNNQARVDVTLVPPTDLNRDGQLNGRDAAQLVFEINDGDGDLVENVAGGSFPGNPDFDVDGNGLINQQDVVALAPSILFRPGLQGSNLQLDETAPAGVVEASVLDFPRLAFEAGGITGIAIVNPNPAQAPVTLTAYSSSGEVLATAERIIPAGQQLSELTFELFGQMDASTMGWFQAVSPLPDLGGFFLDLDGSLSELDGADIPERANEIVFNTIKVDNGFSTELNIVNPNPVALTVTINLIGAEGGLGTFIDIPAMGSWREDVTNVFGVGSPGGQPATPDSYIVVTADGEILGFQVIRGGTRDFQGLNARSGLELLNKIYIPQMAVLGVYESELGLVNYSSTTVLATVSAFTPTGELFIDEVQQNPAVVSLPAGETVTRDLAELFGFQGSETLQGWLEISSSSQAINGFFSYRIPATGAQAAIAAVPSTGNTAFFSHLATVEGFFTGLAALNTAALPADLRILALSKEGEIYGGFSGVLRPRHRISELMSNLIPESAGRNGGIIFVRSTVPLHLISLFGTDDVSVLANIPPQTSPPGFAPDSGLGVTRITPALNVVQPGGKQSFSLPGVAGAVRWTVNGVEGGDPANGLITPQGLYTAPLTPPALIPVTVVGQADGVSSSASVDVIDASSLFEDLGEVLSVAFLDNLGQLFTSELKVLAAGLETQGQGTSSIYSITPDARTELMSFPGEIVQILPFDARDGREYLLLVDATNGTVIRFDPETLDTRTVATGLVDPQSITQDPLTGDLIIADANQIKVLPNFQLQEDLINPSSQPAQLDAAVPIRGGIAAPVGGSRGMAVDICSGILYFSLPAQGKIMSLDRSTGEIAEVLSGLDSPSRLRGLYREGVSCPKAFHLFIVERGRNQIDLYIPSEDTLIAPWLEATRASDLELLPPLSPFRQQRVLVLSRQRQGKQVLSAVNVDPVYRNKPVNPPPNLNPADRAPAPGPDLVVGIKSAKRDRLVRVPLYFRPGPDDQQPGGSDEAMLLMFSLDFDEKRLSFDPTDTDMDGIPDAIQINLPDDYLLVTFYDPALKNRELAFLIIDTVAPYRPLEEAPSVSIEFRTSDTRTGAAVVGFRGTPVHVVDVLGKLFFFDQVLNGGVRVKK